MSEKYERPSWDEYFLKMAALAAERSPCKRHHVGAVIVDKGNHPITTGYNGPPSGDPHCIDIGCRKDELELTSGFGSEECRAIHAEQNAILQAARGGTPIEGERIYCTHTPCRMCAKEIVGAKLREVVTYQEFAGDNGARKYLEDHNVKVRVLKRPSGIITFKD